MVYEEYTFDESVIIKEICKPNILKLLLGNIILLNRI